MYIQIPSYCPRCVSYFDAFHPRSEGLPSNWRHPFDFPPVLDDAPPIVRYCKECRKEPGVSKYLKIGFLFDEYLSHCGDKEYAALLRERIARETRAVVAAAMEKGLEVKHGDLSRKERAKQEMAENLKEVRAENAKKLEEFHVKNKKEFWKDMEVLQRDRKRILRGEGGVLASGTEKEGESRPKSFLRRLRGRSRGGESLRLGISTDAGPSGSVAERGQNRTYGHDGDDVSVLTYDSDETIRARTSVVSSVSRLSLGGDTLRGDLND